MWYDICRIQNILGKLEPIVGEKQVKSSSSQLRTCNCRGNGRFNTIIYKPINFVLFKIRIAKNRDVKVVVDSRVLLSIAYGRTAADVHESAVGKKKKN